MKLSKIVCAGLLGLIATNTLYANEKEELGEITITGEKLEKSLQDTTTSVQVFDETAFINSSKLNDLYDIVEQSTNVNRSGKYAFNIRGINATGIYGSYGGPKTINITVDGVSQGTNASKQGAISTWDMQQVEVLKGPQSTVQGRNSLAGAVVFKTKDPEFESNGAAQIGYGSYNKKQVSVMQTGPITEDLAFRISLDRTESDGFVKNDSFRGDEFNKNEITNLRGKLLYTISDETSALLSLSKLKYNDWGSHVVQGNPTERKSAFNTDGYYNTDAQSHSLEIKHSINDKWSFTSLSGFSDEKFDRFNDFDYLAGNATLKIDRENDSINQEFRFTYEGENSESIIGLYHSSGSGKDDQDAKEVDGSFLYNGLKLAYQQQLKEDYKNTALFFNTDYHITDKLTLIFGARLDKDQRDNKNTISAQRTSDNGGANATIDGQLAVLGNGNIQANTDTTNFLPKLGLNYKWSDDISTGLVYSKGYRPGGISTNPVRAQANTFDAEYTNNYEASFRSQWLNKRLTLNANVFYTIFKDQQVSEQGSLGSFDVHIVNAGKSTMKGIEVESKYEATDNVDVFANVGMIKSEFDEYKNGSNDYSGNELIKTPNLTASLGTTYRNDKGYFVGGNVAYTGSQFGDSANSRKIKGYNLVNLKAGYEKEDWGLYAYVNNLFDKDYMLNNFGSDRYEMGDPRVVGVNFKYYW